MCAFFVGISCVGRFGLGWAHDVFTVACHMFMHFSCIHTILFLLFDIVVDWYFSASLSLSLSFFGKVCAWHPSANPLHRRTLFVLGHLLLLILYPLMLGFVMLKPIRTFQRTFLNVAFIRNARLSFQISSILIYPLLLTKGVGNPFMIS